MSKTSLVRELEMRGYLSLNKFVSYLKQYHPVAAISYPTALKLVDEHKLRATRVGAQYRVSMHEVERWVAEGNWERKFSPESSSPFSNNANFDDYEGGM